MKSFISFKLANSKFSLLTHSIVRFLVFVLVLSPCLSSLAAGAENIPPAWKQENQSEAKKQFFGLPFAYFVLKEPGVSGWSALRARIFGKPEKKETRIEYSMQPGYLGHRFKMGIKATTDFKTRLEVIDGRSSVVIQYSDSNSIYDGSYAVNPFGLAPFISVVEDSNLILILDQEGRIFAIDKVALRFNFGQQIPPMIWIDQISLEKDKKYNLALNDGPWSQDHLQISDEMISADLADQEIADGSFMVIEEGTKPKLVNIISRANIIRGAFLEHIRLAALTAPYNKKMAESLAGLFPGIQEVSKEFSAQLERDQPLLKDPKQLEKLASFESSSLASMVKSLGEQLSQSHTNPKRTLGEWLSLGNISVSSLSRSVMKFLLNCEGDCSLDPLIQNALHQVRIFVQQGAQRGDLALQNLEEVFQSSTNQNAGINFQLQALVATAERSGFDFATWVDKLSVSSALSSEQKNIAVAALKVVANEGGVPVSTRLSLSSFLELRSALRVFIKNNPRHSNAAVLNAALEKLNQLESAGNPDHLLADLDKVQNILKGFEGAPFLDLLISIDASDDANYLTYLERARVFKFKGSWVDSLKRNPKIATSLKFLKVIKNEVFSIPNIFMGAGLGFVALVPWIQSNFGDTSGVAILSKAIEAPFKEDYRPLLFKAMTYQFAMLILIQAGFSIATLLRRQGETKEVLANKFGLFVYGKFLSFPYIAGITRLLGQQNILYASDHGVWPTPMNGGIHFPTWPSLSQSERSKARINAARARLIQTVKEKEFAEATSRILAYKAASQEILGDSLQLNGSDVLSIMSQVAEFRRKRILAEEEKFSLQIREALQSADSDLVSKVDAQIARARINQRNLITDENHQISVLAKLLSAHLEPELRKHLSGVEISDSQFKDLEVIAQNKAHQLNKKSSFMLWARNIGRSCQAAVKSSACILKYPISIFEATTRASPRPEVANNNWRQWSADMVIQYVTLGLASGYPFQDIAQSHLGRRIPMRADLQQPNELFGHDNHELPMWKQILYPKTHPDEGNNLIDQHRAYLVSAQAINSMDLGVGTAVHNPYSSFDIPAHEKEEPFMNSLWGTFTGAFKLREAGYRAYFNRQVANKFKFIQASLLTMLVLRVFLRGLDPVDVLGQYIFSTGMGMWAFGWPWAPLTLGFSNHGQKLQKQWEAFDLARRNLEQALIRQDLSLAQNAVIELKAQYASAGKAFEPAKRWGSKTPLELTHSDLEQALEYSKRTPASYFETNRHWNELGNLLFGAIPTTLLGISFFIFSFKVDLLTGSLWGGAGLFLYGVANRFFWAQEHFGNKVWDKFNAELETLKQRDEMQASSSAYSQVMYVHLQNQLGLEQKKINESDGLSDEQKAAMQAELLQLHAMRLDVFEKRRAELLMNEKSQGHGFLAKAARKCSGILSGLARIGTAARLTFKKSSAAD